MLLLGLEHPCYMVNKVRYSDTKSHGVFKSMASLCGIPVNTKHVYNAMLDLGPRRWTDVVHIMVVHMQFSKLFEGLECAVLSMVLCTIKNP